MAETTEQVMRATYRALSSRGYANLTMEAIAEEAGVSTAALHYHYDSKADLLAACHEYLSERFLTRLREADTDGAADRRLSMVLDAAVSPPESDDIADLQTALLELKAQAPYQAAYRERFRRVDDEFRSHIADILAAGVDSGVFRADLDTEQTAHFIVTVLAGGGTRHVSVGQRPQTTRDLLRDYVDRELRRNDGDGPGREARRE